MISGTEPANAAVVACDTPATTRPHAARVGAWALADWLIPLALALVTFAVFSPALSNNFVDWDDQINLTGNEEYRGLGTAQLKYFFTTVLMGHYIPLTWLTFGLDYVQWGMNPTGYHLTSLLLYAANAAVLYLVSLRLLARAPTCWRSRPREASWCCRPCCSSSTSTPCDSSAGARWSRRSPSSSSASR